ncbi:MAG: DNA-binding protein [Porticoccaceae bacterium]|nr:MAG: DNA-binding protein [Porticoccaceae bacterium]
MQLTDFADFGMRLLMWLAARPEEAHSTAALAEELGLSRDHLAKIVSHLARAGYLHTSRGTGGGLRLARDPGEIRLGELLRVLDRDLPLVACFGTRRPCSLEPHCRLRPHLAEAREAFYRALDRHTLAEVALPAAVAVSRR